MCFHTRQLVSLHRGQRGYRLSQVFHQVLNHVFPQAGQRSALRRGAVRVPPRVGGRETVAG
jgi:hypothetical protein